MSVKKGNKLTQFWNELKRRKVIKVIAMYAATAFIIMEAGDIMFPRLGLPDWTVTFIIVLLIIGFPIVIILSWIFDITPEGVKKTEPIEVAKEQYPPSVPVKKRLKVSDVIIAVLIVVVGILAYPKVFISDKHEEIRDADRIISIAVLPFVDMSPNKDQEYFCDGMAEEIINSLSHITDLRVVARTSAFSFKGKNMDIREIGKKLNVSNILEGSVRKSNNLVRITAQLVNTEDGSHIWSRTYDKELKNIFSIQDEIALSVVDNLKLEMSEEENIISAGTKNSEAYEAYLQGQYFSNKLQLSDYQKAIDYFKESIEIDPLFAKPYAGLADIYNNFSMWGENSPRENKLKAKEESLKALELDPDLSEAYMVLADIKYGLEREWQTAEELFKKSIKLNQGSAMAHSYYGMFLMAMTRYDEAVAEVKKSLKLDPFSLVLNMNAYFLSMFAQKEDFKKQCIQKLLILDPDSSSIDLALATDYFYKEMYDDVITILGRIPEHDVDDGELTLLACAYARLGNTDEARTILNHLLIQEKNKYIDPFRFANINISLKNMDKSFEWLDKSVTEFSPRVIYIKCYPELDPIRSDPRYFKILRKLGLEK